MRTVGHSRESQSGSATIEATISLVIFVFVIFGIYMMANFCIVQAKVSYAIDATAKEMSQYSYFYHVLGLDGEKAKLGDKASQAVSAYENLTTLISTDAKEITEDPKEVYGRAKDAVGSVSEAISDPQGFMESVAAYAGEKAIEMAAVPLARGMTEQHIGADADAYLESMGVVDGYDGLRFDASRLFADEGGKKIEIVVCYRLSLKSIIPNPALNQEVVIYQKAVTDAWLGGDAR